MAITPDIPEVDTAVLGRAIVEHRSSLEALVRARVPRRDVDDVMQNLYLRAHERWHTYDFDRPLGPWLHAIARNLCADHGRADRRGEVAVDPSMLSGPPSPSPEQVIDLREGRAAFRRAWQALSDDRRHLVAAGAEGRPYTELAAKLHLTEEAVRGRLKRARHELRALVHRAEEGLLALVLPFRRLVERMGGESVGLVGGVSSGAMAGAAMVMVAVAGLLAGQGPGAGGGHEAEVFRATSPPALIDHVPPVDAADESVQHSTGGQAVGPVGAGAEVAAAPADPVIHQRDTVQVGGNTVEVDRTDDGDWWHFEKREEDLNGGTNRTWLSVPCFTMTGSVVCPVLRALP